jgi:hypothetical protein
VVPGTEAVISVPPHFYDAPRQTTKDAGRIAGLDALAYGLDKKKRLRGLRSISTFNPFQELRLQSI